MTLTTATAHNPKDTMTTQLDLRVCNFKHHDPANGVAVRISNGAPRWRLPYSLEWAVKPLMPEWSLVKAKLPHDEFARRYRAALDATGVATIESSLRAIAVASGDNRLVLMCFEDLSTGKTCHRSVFARWWTDVTGNPVRELGPTLEGDRAAVRTPAAPAPLEVDAPLF